VFRSLHSSFEPFDIGGDPKQAYFADGVTESLTTDLSRISGSFVIARNAAFTYKGKHIDVKTIGRELGVRHALEGSSLCPHPVACATLSSPGQA
jgi:TolB-like protein